MDIKAVLGEPLFLFLIGAESKKFHIHLNVLRETSDRLYKMTQPGWKEHEVGFAVLADTEPLTFALFAEYAYVRAYNVRGVTSEEHKAANFDKPFLGLREFSCRNCATHRSTSDADPAVFPFCGEACKTRRQRINPGYSFAILCVSCRNTFGSVMRDVGEPALCKNCTTIQLGSKAMGQDTIRHKPSGQDFCNLRIGVGSEPYEKVIERLRVLTPNEDTTGDWVAHVKLYAFADYNLIPELKDLCLHRLHSDLLAFRLTKDSAPRLVELMVFTYDNTDSSESENHEDGQAKMNMRRLVTSYAVGLAQELVELKEFEAMLAKGGDLVTDFVAGISKRLT